jgi:tight adherence protein B
MTLAAISSAGYALIVLLATGVVFLYGLWLLLSSSARRSALAVRGGIELRRRRRVHERLDERLARTRRGADLGGRLRSAGTERTASQFLLMVLAIGVLTLLIISLLFPVLIALLAAIFGSWGCFIWLERKLEKRGEEFISQLPEVARLLSGGASAGLSIPAAIELTVREIDAPAREELQVVVDELTLGRSLEETLDGLRRRLPSREVAVLMSTLIIQQRAGGDTVRALRDLADTLDKRRETNREVRTLMAGAIYTAYVVPALGVLSLLLLNTINSHTLNRMTETAAGLITLAVAAIIYALAFVALRRVTRIEV